MQSSSTLMFFDTAANRHADIINPKIVKEGMEAVEQTARYASVNRIECSLCVNLDDNTIWYQVWLSYETAAVLASGVVYSYGQNITAEDRTILINAYYQAEAVHKVIAAIKKDRMQEYIARLQKEINTLGKTCPEIQTVMMIDDLRSMAQQVMYAVDE